MDNTFISSVTGKHEPIKVIDNMLRFMEVVGSTFVITVDEYNCVCVRFCAREDGYAQITTNSWSKKDFKDVAKLFLKRAKEMKVK